MDLEFRIEETLFQRDLSLRKSVTLIMSILLSNPKLGSLVFRPENVTIISLVAICTGPPSHLSLTESQEIPEEPRAMPR